VFFFFVNLKIDFSRERRGWEAELRRRKCSLL